MADGQIDMFPNLAVRRSRNSKEYGIFTDKFKTKLTTDDCYTPELVYNAVKDWTVKRFRLENCEIVRPFWPGGDFETFDYPENSVVIDNPPFSIYDKILKFYTENGIKFMLFGPALTLFKRYDCCYIVVNETVTYKNGAKINTSFVTNLDKDYRVMTCVELKNAIRIANVSNQQKKADLPVLKFTDNVITSALLGKTARVDFKVKKTDAQFVTNVANYKVFGSAFLLSDRAAADRAAERKSITISLTQKELDIVERLNNGE